MLDVIILIYRWTISGPLNVEIILPRVPGWIIGHCQGQNLSHACLIPKSKHLDSKHLLFGYLKSGRLRQEKQEYCKNSLKHGLKECVITMPSRNQNKSTRGQSRGPLGVRSTAQRMNPVRAQWGRNPKGRDFSTYPQHIVTHTHGWAPLLLSTYTYWKYIHLQTMEGSTEIPLLFLFSCSVMSDSLQHHGLQHARLPCPSPTPRVCSNSCPLNRWCHPTISSSVIPFSYLQSFSASRSFPMSQFFASGGQSIGQFLLIWSFKS